MRALITGGGGFLGRALAQALKAEGREVRTFARGAYPELAEQGIHHHRGTVESLDALKRAVEGCDVVFHTAAKVGVGGAKADYIAVNVRGTENVIDACRASGVRRLVFTSTPSVVIGGGDLEGVDESQPYPSHYGAPYAETKAEAEQRILAAHGEGLSTVSLRPHIVYGPGDTSLLPRVVKRARRLRRIGPGGKLTDVCYIDDCVKAHLLADRALKGRPSVVGGKPYFISSGEPVEIWSFVNMLLEAAGRPPITKSMSVGTASFIAGLMESVNMFLGGRGEPMLTRWVVAELASSHWFDISAARRDLGYTPEVKIEEGRRRLKAWIEQSHWRP